MMELERPLILVVTTELATTAMLSNQKSLDLALALADRLAIAALTPPAAATRGLSVLDEMMLHLAVTLTGPDLDHTD